MAEVRAAGAVVLRASPSGFEVLVVHRPRYDDWSLPKGKLDDGETFEAAAVRELAEETGVEVELGPSLPETRYVDLRGRDKVVRWWRAAPRAVRPREPDDEVDEVRWVTVAEAHDLLTYGPDRDLVDHALAEEPRP